ncbi:MAG: molecular chaperone DnaJ [Actinobacteria bacterium]|nr:molecular chaperone DnaJ [Actinomycetota bacterium]
MADYYELLGVSRGATADELKRAYRQRARELHPDANPGNPSAEAQFKEVALAYETLSDPQRRQQYDMYGESGMRGGSPFGGGGGGGGGLGDIFDMFFNGGSPFGGGGGPSGPPRGADVEAVITIDFAEAVFGCEAAVSVRTAVACAECEGTGADPGSGPVTCHECGGAGQVRRVRQSILGQMVTAGPCGRCSGFGTVIERPCSACAGEGRHLDECEYTVDVPAGVDTGQTLRLSGRGAVGPRNGSSGDLYVHIRVTEDERFIRRDDDLIYELAVAFTQATLGAQITIETLDGDELIPVDPGTASGDVIRFRGKGVPHLQGRGRGDLLVRLVVETPKDLDDEQRSLLEKLAALRGEDIDPPEQGLMSKLRGAFK